MPPMRPQLPPIQLNMGEFGSCDNFAMDDPITPLYNSAGSPSDQEPFLPLNCDYKTINTMSDLDNSLELPIDLVELLNETGLNFDLLDGDFLSATDCISQQNVGITDNTNLFNEAPSQNNQVVNSNNEMPNQVQDEEAIMEFEEMGFSDLSPLNIQLAQTDQSKTDVTTPEIINLLLENEAHKERTIPLFVQEIKPEPVEARPGSKPRKSAASGTSDLRRVRNNIASRKSRENRKKKQMTQKQHAEELELENRKLETLVREYETLLTQLKGYVHRGIGA